MGFLQTSLKKRLRKAGPITLRTLDLPTQESLAASDLAPAVLEIYKQLGGVHDEPQFKIRNWDLEYEGIAIELDEYLSFNRYRLLSLNSPAYKQLPLFPMEAYKQYCAEHEGLCLKSASTHDKWSTEASEMHFGPAAPAGELDNELGASRWRQRAFYDFVKDLSPLLCNVQVVRLSIWDEVKEGNRSRPLLDVLKTPLGESPEAIANLIDARSGR